MLSFIVFSLLFLLPFLIAPFGVTQFENPKVTGAEVGIILLFIISLFANEISFRGRKSQLLLYSCIFLLTCLDLLFFRTNISFFGNAFRMQGVFLLWCLLLFSYFSSNISLRKIPWWIFFLVLLIEFIAMFFLPLNASQRYVGTLGEPNALAGFVIFLWPFMFFASGKYTKRRWLFTIVGCIIVSLILKMTDSRSALIAFGIQIIFLVGAKNLLPLRSATKATVICLIFYLMSYVLPFFQQVPYENRVEVWEAALLAGVINPAFGQGFGNTEIALHNSAAGLNVPVQYYYVDSSHNIFLDWWAQGGVIGLSILLLLVYMSFKTFIQAQNQRELVLLLGMLTVLSFNPGSIVELLAFWRLIGQGLASLTPQGC